jgi:Sulfotransferase family
VTFQPSASGVSSRWLDLLRLTVISQADLSLAHQETTMDHEESAITRLAVTATSRPQWLLGIVPLLKRTSKAFGWRVVKASWLLTREGNGLVHWLQRRRIAHFLHIGKTGGTAVASVLSGHLKSSDYEIILHDHDFTLNNVPRGEKVFFFVRDPIDRFVSGFYSRKRQGRPRHDVPWSRGEEAAFGRFTTPNELALALTSADQGQRAAAVDAMNNISHIRSPHWIWLRDESYFLARRSDILFVGFQETLNDDFSLLGKLLNLPEGIKLPDDDIASHKNPSGFDKRLDEAALRNLTAWYERDYQFLELCREVAARIRDNFQRGLRRSDLPEPATFALAESDQDNGSSD